MKEELVVSSHAVGESNFHIQLTFVSNVRFVSEVEMIRQIKGYSSYMMRKGHRYFFDDKLWGNKF